MPPSAVLAARPAMLRPPPRRGAAFALIVVMHALVLWGVANLEPVRSAMRAATPVLVTLIATPATPPPAPPRPVASPRTTPAPSLTRHPSLPAEPTPEAPPTEVVALPAPAPVTTIVAAPPAPPPPAAAVVAPPAPSAPATPRTVALGTVAYRIAPAPAYPPPSRRAREEGEVHVRALVDADGTPRELEIVRGSGHARLDEAALAAVRAARFRAYLEHGVALPFRVVIPIVFELAT